MTDQQTTEQNIDQALAERPDLQYLKSAGEDVTEFLPKPADDVASKEAADKAAAEKAATDKAAAEAAAGGKVTEEPEPGEVRVGDDGRVRDAKGRFVPVKALHEERDRRKGLEKQLADTQAQLLALAGKAQPAPAQAGDGKAKDGKPANPFEEADIDPDKDLLGAVGQERRRNAWLRSQQEANVKATSEQLTQSDMMQAYRDDTARVVAARPDYREAYKHVVVSRAREMIAFGVADKDTIAKQIREDEQDIVRQAVAAGKSPAETIYALAIAKGYLPAQAGTPKSDADKAAEKAAADKAAATTAAATTAAAGKTAAQEIVESIKAGQESGKTLSSAGGGAAPGLTLDQYLEMTPEQILAMQKTTQGYAQLKAIGAVS